MRLICYLFWGIFFCASWQCSGKKTSNGSNSGLITSESSPDSIPEASETINLPRITSENVQEVLTKFGKAHPETKILLKTRLGDMTIRLYEGTPLHRANFLQLVKRDYYNGTVFHRVVKDLVIQGGNLDNPSIRRKKNEIGFYRVPAEFKPQQYYHKRGALASPRRDEENPEKRSNPFEFYIVQGSPLQPAVVQALGAQNQVTYRPEQVQTYASIGGLPHLDGKYTVFGEVVEGLEVIDKIAELEVDDDDSWPFEDVFIQMEVLE